MSFSIEAKALSHDPAVVEAYIADPLVFKTFNARWFFEARRAQEEVLKRAAEIRLPVLMMLGTATPSPSPSAAARSSISWAARTRP